MLPCLCRGSKYAFILDMIYPATADGPIVYLQGDRHGTFRKTGQGRQIRVLVCTQ